MLLPDQDAFSAQWRKQLGLEAEAPPSARKLSFPREFRPLSEGGSLSRGFWDYLADRGYSGVQRGWAAKAYDLQYALSGRFAYRIIIPVVDRRSQLVTWTARAIDREADIRYLTLSRDQSRAAPGELLLGLPLLSRAAPARCLAICEGPFDAIAVSAIGHSRGIYGTCLFGLELSDAQADLLSDISDSFDRVKLLLDPEQAWLRTLDMRSKLPKRCKPVTLPKGYKDPGTLIGDKRGEDFVLSLAA